MPAGRPEPLRKVTAAVDRYRSGRGDGARRPVHQKGEITVVKGDGLRWLDTG